MNHNNILVTTIIPSYNKHHFLKEALFSVLNQSHTNQEIIIVNDYPSIEAKDELDELKKIDNRIIVLHNAINIGIAASRNKAIQYSRGKYIAMLDHDDIWYDNDKITKQIAALEGDKNMSVIGTQYVTIDALGNHIEEKKFPLTDSAIRDKINFIMPSLQSSFVFPKSALEKIGGFNPTVSMSDDYEILFRVLQVGKMQNLADFTTLYRLHDNTSMNQKNFAIMRKNSLKILLQYGVLYPHYPQAVLRRLCRDYPYSAIRPYLSDKLVEGVKIILGKGKSNQSYNHTNYQDEA